MIVKMNNKSKDFYSVMGKFFGSRTVERETNDRIYDDDKKEWYVYFDKDIPVAFVSVSSNTVKNIYTKKDDYLVELFKHITKEIKIEDSVVTNSYKSAYLSSNLVVSGEEEYKNFVRIRCDLK